MQKEYLAGLILFGLIIGSIAKDTRNNDDSITSLTTDSDLAKGNFESTEVHN